MAAEGSNSGFPSPFELQFTELDCSIREPVQVKQDFGSLFSVAQEVLRHTTVASEKCLLGKNKVITPKISKPVPSINYGLNVLQEIYCNVTCEAHRNGNAEDSVIKFLSTYSWAEKAVLTLAAFALSYGELWVYVVRQQLNPLALSISSLRRVDEIIRVKKEDRLKTAIIELNKLTNQIIEFIESILELDNLSKKDCIRYMRTNIVTEMTAAVECYSRFGIQFVVVCMTVVKHLTYTKIKIAKDLSSPASFVNDKLKTLQKTIENYKLEIAEWEAYSILDEAIRRGLGIVEVMTRMMSSISEPYHPDYCYNENLPVAVDQLEGNNVLLIISGIDNISEDDFSSLMMIHEMLEKEQRNYKIVWIPVLEGESHRSVDPAEKIEEWKRRMPWYVASYDLSKPIVGIKYIKERWEFRFRCNPMVVVLNTQGREECLDAMHMIRAWGPSAFPFNRRVADPGMGPIIFDITNKEIKEEEYIFLYVFKDQGCNRIFDKRLKNLASDDEVRANISPRSFAVGEKSSSMKTVKFLNRMEYMLCARMQWDMSDNVTKEIQRLLSLKDNEDGWAMLCKGPKLLACYPGTIIMDAVAKYPEWTKYMDKENFETRLHEYIANKPTARIPCRHAPFQSCRGWLPVDLECPDCRARMERILTYK